MLTTDLAEWHTYTLDWLPSIARFAVDGAEALRVHNPPRGAFGFGTLASGLEARELDSLRIMPILR